MFILDFFLAHMYLNLQTKVEVNFGVELSVTE